jgi:hypothetical protein
MSLITELVVGAVAAAATVTGATQSGATSAGPAHPRSDLARVAAARIFFGHQSVGMNILGGLKALAAEEGVALRIVESARGADLEPGTVAHAFIGKNGDPRGKLEAFEAAMAAFSGRDPDVALMKFCFVDFAADTDVAALFDRYQATMARLKAAHPRTVFVHLTVPLTTTGHGPRDFLKRLLGRTTSAAVNARREAFSDLLRSRYGGREPLFDLAREESTAPDGQRETGTWGGRPVPALVPAYTDDGGHLDAVGARRVATALVSMLGPLLAGGESGESRREAR